MGCCSSRTHHCDAEELDKPSSGELDKPSSGELVSSRQPATSAEQPEQPGPSSGFYFVRDDHTSTVQQARLAADLHKYANGSLWLEFFYEEQLAAVRAAFATPGVVDDEAVLAQVKKAVMSNGWSDAFNESLVDLLRLAHQHSISIHALDTPEWSLDAFTERYGTFRGRLKYLANRASQENDDEGATSRWAKRVMEAHAEGTAPAPVVVMGGAEHGPVMLEIVPVFEFMYEDAGAVRAAAKAKVEAELAAAKEARSEAEAEEAAAEATIGSALALFSR